MSQSTPQILSKRITIKATIQRLWDCEVLAHYREQYATDEEYMQRLATRRANGEPVWVDCHDVVVTWVGDGLIQIGREQYAVGPPDDGYHLRCMCVGCRMDMSYCQLNHQLRISDFYYKDLWKKARAALLPDGAVIRFSHAFDLGVTVGKHDTFRKGPYTYAERQGGRSVKKTGTFFFTLDTHLPFHIVHWQRLEWEIVSLPADDRQQAETEHVQQGQ